MKINVLIRELANELISKLISLRQWNITLQKHSSD